MTSPTSAPLAVLGSQEPRLSWIPPYISSAGQEATELAARAGLHLDPWEQFVLVGGLGERVDGKWSAFEVGVDVPRQNGKGSILEARELAGAILFGERLIIHSAHEQATSSEHFLRLLALFEEAELSSRMKKPVRGKGSEAILFKNGTRILFKTRTGGGGRGLTGDLVVLDEAMILPESTTAALVPTMAARSIAGNPQLWYAGSAVDQEKHEHGIVFARLRKRGLGKAPRVAWFEWSVEGDSPAEISLEVLSDPESWAQANPGMGIRISEEHIANECGGALGPREFAVERLGVGDWPNPDAADGEVISGEAWKARTDLESVPQDPVCFAFDVKPDRSKAAIGVAGFREDGGLHVEIVEHKSGTGWVPDRLLELTRKHPSVGVICDQAGPAAALLAQLAGLGVDIRTVSAREYAQACGMLFDKVEQGTVWHHGTPELLAAIRGAGRRPLVDAWAWSRKASSADISPLVAITLALWGSVDAGPPGGGFEW